MGNDNQDEDYSFSAVIPSRYTGPERRSGEMRRTGEDRREMLRFTDKGDRRYRRNSDRRRPRGGWNSPFDL